MEDNCLFCKIVNNELPTEFVYESENLIVFKDIHPQAPVHLLIVPKRHIRSINDLEAKDEKILAEMIMTGKKMAQEMKVAQSGYKLKFNVERGGGQLVFHLHMHLIGGWVNK